jgi:hypothetical protein
MGHMDMIDAPYAIGLPGAAALIGSLLTFVGTNGLIKVSQIFADKEKECQENSNTKLACKIAKWAFLAFAAIVGTVGAISLGLAVLAVVGLMGNPTLSMPLGITTAALVGLYVIGKVWQQAANYIQPDLPKTV